VSNIRCALLGADLHESALYREYISLCFNGNGWFFGGPVGAVTCAAPSQEWGFTARELDARLTEKVTGIKKVLNCLTTGTTDIPD